MPKTTLEIGRRYEDWKCEHKELTEKWVKVDDVEQLRKELTALAIPNMVETKWNKDGDVTEYTNMPSVTIKNIYSVFDKVMNK